MQGPSEASATMANKALAQRATEEVWNKGNIVVADEVYAPDIIRHDPTLPAGKEQGREAFKKFVNVFRTAFPDGRVTLDDLVAEGDKVAVRYSFQGTHAGELVGIPATGRRVTVTGIAIARVAAGKCQEMWDSFDNLGLLQQLGVIPRAEQE